MSAAHVLRRTLLETPLRGGVAAPSSMGTRAMMLAATSSSSQASARRLFHVSARNLAANPKSGGPTSSSVSQAAKNIKEEASAVSSSVASAISGKSTTSKDVEKESQNNPSGMDEILSDAKSITAEMAKAVPQPALLWGAAGIIPYVSTAAASIWLARQAKLVAEGVEQTLDLDTAQALLLHAENLQLTYGAAILSFLGAIHWGFEFSKYGGVVGNTRYALGVFPVLVAWPSLLFTPQLGLIAQWAAFVSMWFIDLRATSRGWVPGWYSTYRFWLTAFVGTSIIATLAGTQYYDTDASRSSARGTAARLAENAKEDASRKMRLLHQSAAGDKGGRLTQITGIESDVISKSAGEEGDSFVKVENPKKQQEEEEKKRKEEEEKKAKGDE